MSEYVGKLKHTYVHDLNIFLMQLRRNSAVIMKHVSYLLIKHFHILLYALIISPTLVCLVKQPPTALQTA